MPEKETALPELGLLADLLRVRNATEVAITRIIGRPAQIGHIGEYIASRIFRIELEGSAVHPGADGRFIDGPLAGKSVNVKMYGKLEGALDIREEYLPDYYLVLTGARATEITSKGITRPWVIELVFLFEAHSLVERLRERGVKLGPATSVVSAEWEAGRVYPVSDTAPLLITKDQEHLLQLFGTAP